MFMVEFGQASKKDIPELIELRYAYMMEDFGYIPDKEKMGEQLVDYYSRKLGNDFIAFVVREDNHIVSIVGLNVLEMPASSQLLNGKYGVVLNVYTEPEYRGKGYCTKLMNTLLEYGREIGLGRIDCNATRQGYPIYKKVGFKDRDSEHAQLRYIYK